MKRVPVSWYYYGSDDKRLEEQCYLENDGIRDSLRRSEFEVLVQETEEDRKRRRALEYWSSVPLSKIQSVYASLVDRGFMKWSEFPAAEIIWRRKWKTFLK